LSWRGDRADYGENADSISIARRSGHTAGTEREQSRSKNTGQEVVRGVVRSRI